MSHPPICPCPNCTPRSAAPAALGCLALAFGGAALTTHMLDTPAVAAFARGVLDVCGAFCGVMTIAVVAVAWRAGLVARASAGVMWTCTQVWRVGGQARALALPRAQARALAGARAPVAALAQGPGVVTGRAVSSEVSSRAGVPRSDRPTTTPATVADDEVTELLDRLGVEGHTAWQREVVAAMLSAPAGRWDLDRIGLDGDGVTASFRRRWRP